ncbi:MAG: hypothetical protein M5R42_01815 [Rhodocyclaceae bacterium]|nr:hypothetical protein [Rhodocyclaceae bacterium]
MRDEALPEDGELVEQVVPELEPAAEPEFLNDVTQIYLNEIGANRVADAGQDCPIPRLARQG